MKNQYCTCISHANNTEQTNTNLVTLSLLSDRVKDNKRYEALQFQITEDSVVHGLAGYFEAHLYKDVMLSIKPDTHSRGMFSWFPILFPLRVGGGCLSVGVCA